MIFSGNIPKIMFAIFRCHSLTETTSGMVRHRPHDNSRGLISCLHNLIRSRNFWILLSLTLLILLLIHTLNPYQFTDSASHLSHIAHLVLQDTEVHAARQKNLAAEIEYELFRYQSRYREERCNASDAVSGKSAWLTLVRDDDLSVVQAVVLGHMLSKLSCVRLRLAAVPQTTTVRVKDLLQKAGYQIVELPALNCGTEPSDHVILAAWNLTLYDRLVYLDTATFPVSSLDDVFDTIHPGKISSPYRSPPGVADTAFSAGMFGFIPHKDTFSSLLAEFQNRSHYTCPDVMNFLWYFFAREDGWVRLPYSYNVRNDRYFPMKSYNFAEVSKLGNVWEWHGKPTRQQAELIDKPFYSLEDLYSMWWKMLYEGLERGKLWHWWHYESDVYRRFLHSDPVRDFRAVDIY